MPEQRVLTLRQALIWVALLPITVPGFAIAGAAYGAALVWGHAWRGLAAAIRARRKRPDDTAAPPGLSVVRGDGVA